jgi:nucleotide-binding universal stress UspA family protein
LKAAAELAALLHAELQGLFVEDIDLLRLCGLPFCREVGSFSATVRQLDSRALERQLHALAGEMRAAMEQVAKQMQVHWSFQVARGAVAAELLAASQAAALLSLGRASRARRRALGSTTRSVISQSSRPVLISGDDGGLKYPLTVLYTGSPAAERALRLALQLAQRNDSEVRVLVWSEDKDSPPAEELQEQLDQLFAGQEVQTRTVIARTSANLLAVVQDKKGGTLVLPGEQSTLLAERAGSTILVP